MFKTEEQIQSRLNSKRNLVNRFVNKVDETKVTTTILERPGNIEKPKLTPDEKNEIALRSRLGENQKVLGKEFGVSQSAIGEIEQGNTKVDENLVQSKLDQIQDVAMTKLLESLGMITNEKLDKAKATDLSSIAANMSKVVSNVRGDKKVGDGVQVNVQVFAPEIRPERVFRTIEV